MFGTSLLIRSVCSTLRVSWNLLTHDVLLTMGRICRSGMEESGETVQRSEHCKKKKHERKLVFSLP